ncbi:MAG: hypothetical protein J5545_09000 [Bacteroidaceae bacterium]|nr:hypothetical protein [Bacteroidaceae bacterium]
MKKVKQEINSSQRTIIIRDPYDKRFHYDGWRVEDEGKSVILKVAVDDNTKGELFLPWEEIEQIRQCSWKIQEEVAEEKMRGKRVHCHHLRSFRAYFPACCQIGLHNGPHDVGCLDCPYIDGYIEEYDPEKEFEEIKINMKD